MSGEDKDTAHAPNRESVKTKEIGALSMLEDATSYSPAIPVELDYQRGIASDRTVDLDERLEAYEDIIDSEIGDTNMARARNIEREVSLRQIYLKFEGGNPSGTQKDRIAFAQSLDALRRGYETITVATCGNYGAAMALASSLAGLRCNIVIPQTYHTKRVKEMEDRGAVIIRVPGDYEEAVAHSVALAEKGDMYDANPGGANTLLQLSAYGEIAFEIFDELRDAPAAIAVPVSNGTTLAGIYKGFVRLYRRGKTSRIPRIVGGSSFGKNPIVHAFVKNKERCEDLPPQMIRETSVNEPLINWHSIDGELALKAIRETGGWAANASDKAMLQYARRIRGSEGMDVLPASTAGLVAMLERHRKQSLPSDRFVAILTGRKS